MAREPTVEIRSERPGDGDAVYRVNAATFGQDAEARLVAVLRESAEPFVSLVAVQDGEVIGHVACSPVLIDGVHAGLGLAPLAVMPAHQGAGVGSWLVRESLRRLREARHPWVVVLGDPEYYSRFGFVPASRHCIVCEYAVPAEAFMVVELEPGGLNGVSGTARYHPAFASL